MITEEQQGSMEVKMNSEQVIVREQGLERGPEAQDHQASRSPSSPHSPPPLTPPPAVDDERVGVPISEADDREEGEMLAEEMGWTAENAAEKVPELRDEHLHLSVEDNQSNVSVLSPTKEEEHIEAPPLHSPRLVSPQVDPEGILTMSNSHASPLGIADAPTAHDEVVSSTVAAHDEVVSPTVASPGKKRSKGGRLWKKSGGKKRAEKDGGEPQSPRELLRDAGTQTDQQELLRNGQEANTDQPELQRNAQEANTDQHELQRSAQEASTDQQELGRSCQAANTDQQERRRSGREAEPAAALHASGEEEGAVDPHRVAEGHQAGPKSPTTVQEEEQAHGEGVQDESECTNAEVADREEGEIVEEQEPHEKADLSFSSLKALRSFGRWADVIEDVDIRATDTEPDRIANRPIISVDNQSSDSQEQQEQPRGTTTEQGSESPHGHDIRTGLRVNPNENGLLGKSQHGAATSPRDGTRGSPRSSPRVKGGQRGAFESSRSPRSPRSRLDPRADSWNNHKEQDLRGKTQLGSRDSLSQASRELNWRRRAEEPRVRQDMPRRSSKLGLDGDAKKDEHQDFRSRSQYGAEPQATHKNWVPRRGLGHRGDGEGRAEQSKARGKGKQGGGRDAAEPQSQVTNDSAARQKFDADLKIKKDELFQRSKQSLDALKALKAGTEQARKGGDELEMELNRNLVYEDGELFFLNV